MTAREQLRHLVDALPEPEILAALRFIQFLNQAIDSDLAVDDVATLTSHTEGWVAGLQMAAIAVRSLGSPQPTVSIEEQDAARVAGFIRGFAGSDRYVLDYLMEEVLQGQPEGIQQETIHLR